MSNRSLQALGKLPNLTSERVNPNEEYSTRFSSVKASSTAPGHVRRFMRKTTGPMVGTKAACASNPEDTTCLEMKEEALLNSTEKSQLLPSLPLSRDHQSHDVEDLSLTDNCKGAMDLQDVVSDEDSVPILSTKKCDETKGQSCSCTNTGKQHEFRKVDSESGDSSISSSLGSSYHKIILKSPPTSKRSSRLKARTHGSLDKFPLLQTPISPTRTKIKPNQDENKDSLDSKYQGRNTSDLRRQDKRSSEISSEPRVKDATGSPHASIHGHNTTMDPIVSNRSNQDNKYCFEKTRTIEDIENDVSSTDESINSAQKLNTVSQMTIVDCEDQGSETDTSNSTEITDDSLLEYIKNTEPGSKIFLRYEALERENAAIVVANQQLQAVCSNLSSNLECKVRETRSLKETVVQLSEELQKEQDRVRCEHQARLNYEQACKNHLEMMNNDLKTAENKTRQLVEEIARRKGSLNAAASNDEIKSQPEEHAIGEAEIAALFLEHAKKAENDCTDLKLQLNLTKKRASDNLKHIGSRAKKAIAYMKWRLRKAEVELVNAVERAEFAECQLQLLHKSGIQPSSLKDKVLERCKRKILSLSLKLQESDNNAQCLAQVIRDYEEQLHMASERLIAAQFEIKNLYDELDASRGDFDEDVGESESSSQSEADEVAEIVRSCEGNEQYEAISTESPLQAADSAKRHDIPEVEYSKEDVKKEDEITELLLGVATTKKNLQNCFENDQLRASLRARAQAPLCEVNDGDENVHVMEQQSTEEQLVDISMPAYDPSSAQVNSDVEEKQQTSTKEGEQVQVMVMSKVSTDEFEHSNACVTTMIGHTTQDRLSDVNYGTIFRDVTLQAKQLQQKLRGDTKGSDFDIAPSSSSSDLLQQILFFKCVFEWAKEDISTNHIKFSAMEIKLNEDIEEKTKIIRDLCSAREEKSAALEELNTVEERLKSVEMDLAVLTPRANDAVLLTKSLKVANKQLYEALQEAQELKRTHNEMYIEVTKQRDHDRNLMEKELERMQSELEHIKQVEKDLDAATAKVRMAEKELLDFKTEAAENESNLQARLQAAAAEVDVVSERASKAEQLLLCSNKNLEESEVHLNTIMEKFKIKVTQDQENERHLEERLLNANKKIAQIEQTLQSSNTQVRELETQVLQFTEEKSTLEKSLQLAAKQTDTVGSHFQEMCSKCTELESQQKACNEKTKETKREISEIRNTPSLIQTEVPVETEILFHSSKGKTKYIEGKSVDSVLESAGKYYFKGAEQHIQYISRIFTDRGSNRWETESAEYEEKILHLNYLLHQESCEKLDARKKIVELETQILRLRMERDMLKIKLSELQSLYAVLVLKQPAVLKQPVVLDRKNNASDGELQEHDRLMSLQSIEAMRLWQDETKQEVESIESITNAQGKYGEAIKCSAAQTEDQCLNQTILSKNRADSHHMMHSSTPMKSLFTENKNKRSCSHAQGYDQKSKGADTAPFGSPPYSAGVQLEIDKFWQVAESIQKEDTSLLWINMAKLKSIGDAVSETHSLSLQNKMYSEAMLSDSTIGHHCSSCDTSRKLDVLESQLKSKHITFDMLNKRRSCRMPFQPPKCHRSIGTSSDPRGHDITKHQNCAAKFSSGRVKQREKLFFN